MSVPSDATEISIIDRGLEKAGVEGSSTYQTAGLTWFRDVKALIYSKVRQQKFLQQTKITVLTKGVTNYSVPQDFDEIYKEPGLLKGDIKYNAQGGTLNTLTLSISDSISEGSIVGKKILVLAGTNVNEYRQVSAYDSVTRIATLSEDWSNVPDTTTEYLVITKVIPLNLYGGGVGDGKFEHLSLDLPTDYVEYDEELYLYPTPDKSEYGLLLRYYSNIIKTNNTDAVYTRFLNRCEAALVQFIYFSALKKMDDSSSSKEEGVFFGMLRGLLAKETPTSNELKRRLKR
jgi:hypothetical protein